MNSTSLQCPTCKTALSRISLGGHQVDRCTECHGTWFDDSELAAILESLSVTSVCRAPDAPATNITCPACSTKIGGTIYAHDSGIPINKCATCSGVWLHEGKLQQIANYRHEPHRTDALGGAMSDGFSKSRRWLWVTDLIQSRVLSSVAAATLLVAVLITGRDLSVVLRLAAFMALPMACIWFADSMGNLTGIRTGLGRPAVTEKTPGMAIALGGWLLMFAVIIYHLICRAPWT